MLLRWDDQEVHVNDAEELESRLESLAKSGSAPVLVSVKRIGTGSPVAACGAACSEQRNAAAADSAAGGAASAPPVARPANTATITARAAQGTAHTGKWPLAAGRAPARAAQPRAMSTWQEISWLFSTVETAINLRSPQAKRSHPTGSS